MASSLPLHGWVRVPLHNFASNRTVIDRRDPVSAGKGRTTSSRQSRGLDHMFA
jgi:hypothetical protein